MVQQRPPPHRRGADDGTLRQRIKALVRPDQRIAPVLARQHSHDFGAVGEADLHVFHRMDGGITLAVEQAALEFLHEKPLAAGLGKRAVEDTVTPGGQ